MSTSRLTAGAALLLALRLVEPSLIQAQPLVPPLDSEVPPPPLPPAASQVPLKSPAVEFCDGCGNRHATCLDGSAVGDRCRIGRRLCHHGIDPHARCYFPAPFGATVYSTLDLQKSKGMAARMVLYHYDFEADSSELTCRGVMQVHKLGQRMMHTPFSLIIQPVACNERLNVARREAVLTALEELGLPVPDERVIVAKPPASGLRAEQAVHVHLQSRQLWARGAYVPAAGGGVIGP